MVIWETTKSLLFNKFNDIAKNLLGEWIFSEKNCNLRVK